MIHGSLIDRTGRYNAAELTDLADTLTRYAQLVGAAWGTRAQCAIYRHRPVGAWPIYLLEDSDQANALAYHEVTAGAPTSRVFIRTLEQADMSVTVGLTHEWAEMIVDPWCALGAELGGGRWVGYEICDPVEADEHGFDLNGHRVSDFVYPAWFYPGLGTQIDHTNTLTEPLTLAPGGYASVQENGSWKQITAAATAPTHQAMSHRIARRQRISTLGQRLEQQVRNA